MTIVGKYIFGTLKKNHIHLHTRMEKEFHFLANIANIYHYFERTRVENVKPAGIERTRKCRQGK
jgi:hypothetical protein